MPRKNIACNAGLTFGYILKDTCEHCTIRLTLSIFHNINIVWSKGSFPKSTKLCIRCAKSRGFVTDAEIEDFITNKGMITA